MNQLILALAVALLGSHALTAQAKKPPRPKTHYNESQVPAYDLPAVLTLGDGSVVEDATGWQKRRRELIDLLTVQMFGRMPGKPEKLECSTISVDKILGGAAERRQITISCAEGENTIEFQLLLYLPLKGKQPCPVFLGLNFGGNHTIEADPKIKLSTSWMRSGKGIKDHQASDATRGRKAARWPIASIIKRGYGLATMYYGDIDPDYDDGFNNGVHALFEEKRTNDSWASIAAWSWGLRRAVDCLERESGVDAQRIAVLGHSRLGKTSLWAGAVDDRFAVVISNNSGCGGAALSKRGFGETVARINHSFPHWFCTKYHRYSDNEPAMPFDQHMLIAACAPRPVLVLSAAGDRWADPLGEFLAAKHASPAYELHGLGGIGEGNFPDQGKLVGGSIGYHIRKGKHDLTALDWKVIMTFADRHLN